jgi:hypothetical protein
LFSDAGAASIEASTGAWSIAAATLSTNASMASCEYETVGWMVSSTSPPVA